MTVYFIGAGPGAVDLITVRGFNKIRNCPVCLYAGSLVPQEMIAEAPHNAHIVDTAKMTLPEIIDEMKRAHEAGKDVARVHSGDPSIYGAMHEQMRLLDDLSINYEIIPGVPAFAAAAAAMKQELTIPGVTQSLIITRTSINSSSMPEAETLKNLAASQATLIIHLSAKNIKTIQSELIPIYGGDCPVVVAVKIGWPDEMILRGQLSNIHKQIEAKKITKTAIIFVGQAMEPNIYQNSALYSA